MRLVSTIVFVLSSIFLLSCSSETEKYSQSYDFLNSFNLEFYHNLNEEEGIEYLKNYMDEYRPKTTNIIDSWQHPLFGGRVDKALYSEILSLSESQTAVFFSTGGEDKYSDMIADFLIEKSIDLIIPYMCISACAEDILTAANELYFFDSPVIAYHGSSQNALFHLKSGKHLDPCPNPMSKQRLLDQYTNGVKNKIIRYRKTGHNINFWKEQEKRLKDFSFKFNMKESNHCERIVSYSNADYWLPTSDELKNLLGLKFQGNVCADDVECYSKKLLLYFGPDQKFIINGNIYTT